MFGLPTLGRVKFIYPMLIPFIHKATVDFGFNDVKGGVWQVTVKDMGFLVIT